MSENPIILGPILSFRGSDHTHWHVTALFCVADNSPFPEVIVENRLCTAPIILLEHEDKKIIRYDLSCKMEKSEREVEYGIKGKASIWRFVVPGRGQTPRMAYVSCNGTSDDSIVKNFRFTGGRAWQDLLCSHDNTRYASQLSPDKQQQWHARNAGEQGAQRFHILLMGGDQIYFDAIWGKIDALRTWARSSRKKQLASVCDERLKKEIQDYYYRAYYSSWLQKQPESQTSESALEKDIEDNEDDAADAVTLIPTIMMWDDHDIFDGWGSYDQDMQSRPLFQTLFQCARKAFWVFQLQHDIQCLPELIPKAGEGNKGVNYMPIKWDGIKQDPLLLPFLNDQPGFTSVHFFGVMGLLVADLRTERTRHQILGDDSWKAIKTSLRSINTDPRASGIQHVIFMSSVPVIYPKLTIFEGGYQIFGDINAMRNVDTVNDNEDDMRDHWVHDDHEGECNTLLSQLFLLTDKKICVTIVSGDVHVAAWGKAVKKSITSSENYHEVRQVISSAIVNAPIKGIKGDAFYVLLNILSRKPRLLDNEYQLEMLRFPNFDSYIMPARNWLSLELDESKPNVADHKLWITWRCERAEWFSVHQHAIAGAAITNTKVSHCVWKYIMALFKKGCPH